MFKEAFLGIYGIREPESAASMPGAHDTGLWQVWELPDGDYIVQPVDAHYLPVGDSCILDRMEFVSLLAPVAVGEEVDPFLDPQSDPRAPDAGSADLLDYWYRQESPDEHAEAAAESPDSRDSGSEDRDEMEDLLADASEETPVTVDERMFTPVWHPDEALSDPGMKSGREDISYPVDAFPESGATEKKQAKGPGFLAALLARGGDAVRVMQPSGAKENAVRSDIESPPATYAEHHPEEIDTDMRSEFTRLMAQTQDSPQPALEQRLAALIARKGNFNEEHKFLFSRFGLELRRKRKHYLALAAHQRALSLAPDDENILFNVARAEYELGNFDRARSALAKALEIAPDFSSAKTFLDFLSTQ